MENVSLKFFTEKVKNIKEEEDIHKIIFEVLESQNVFVFGELLQLPNVQKMRNSVSLKSRQVFNTLEIFAYGDVENYVEEKRKRNVFSLNSLQMKKLQMLTIVSIASKKRQVKLHDIKLVVLGNVESNEKKMKEKKKNQEEDRTSENEDMLQLWDGFERETNVAIEDAKNYNSYYDEIQLEYLIIECIYSGLIEGKINQEKGIVDIYSTITRDVQKKDLNSMINVLNSFDKSCDEILNFLAKLAAFQTEETERLFHENMQRTLEIKKYQRDLSLEEESRQEEGDVDRLYTECEEK